MRPFTSTISLEEARRRGAKRVEITQLRPDLPPVLAAAKRDQPLPEHRPELWRASFQAVTASAMRTS